MLSRLLQKSYHLIIFMLLLIRGIDQYHSPVWFGRQQGKYTFVTVAIMHSHALGRPFVLARDEAALDVLTEADRELPVLFFAEAEKTSRLGLEGLRVLLDLRAEFGPAVKVEQVSAACG